MIFGIFFVDLKIEFSKGINIPYRDILFQFCNHFFIISCELTNGESATKLAEDLLDEDNILIKDLSTKKGFEKGSRVIPALLPMHLRKLFFPVGTYP